MSVAKLKVKGRQAEWNINFEFFEIFLYFFLTVCRYVCKQFYIKNAKRYDKVYGNDLLLKIYADCLFVKY